MQRYFRGSGRLSSTGTDQTYLEDENGDYAIIGSRPANPPTPPDSDSDGSRSPTDPLPDPHDIPGYLKTDFHRFTIFNPNKK